MAHARLAAQRCYATRWLDRSARSLYVALNRMNPEHFVAFYVVLPLFVGLLLLQLVLWLLG